MLFVKFSIELSYFEASEYFGDFDISLLQVEDTSFYIEIIGDNKFDLFEICKYYDEKYKDIEVITTLNQFLEKRLYLSLFNQ